MPADDSSCDLWAGKYDNNTTENVPSKYDALPGKWLCCSTCIIWFCLITAAINILYPMFPADSLWGCSWHSDVTVTNWNIHSVSANEEEEERHHGDSVESGWVTWKKEDTCGSARTLGLGLALSHISETNYSCFNSCHYCSILCLQAVEFFPQCLSALMPCSREEGQAVCLMDSLRR